MDDESLVLKIIGDYLLTHSRKDTRESVAKMFGITDLAEYFASSEKADRLQKLATLVLQLERLQGEEGLFMKMIADLDGTGAKIDKQIAAFVEKYCKTCRDGKNGKSCSILMRVYPRKECYAYHKKEEEDINEAPEPEPVKEQTSKSEHDEIEDSLPCKDCQNAPTCDRTFFYAAEEGGYACNQKVSAVSQEIPASY